MNGLTSVKTIGRIYQRSFRFVVNIDVSGCDFHKKQKNLLRLYIPGGFGRMFMGNKKLAVLRSGRTAKYHLQTAITPFAILTYL